MRGGVWGWMRDVNRFNSVSLSISRYFSLLLAFSPTHSHSLALSLSRGLWLAHLSLSSTCIPLSFFLSLVRSCFISLERFLLLALSFSPNLSILLPFSTFYRLSTFSLSLSLSLSMIEIYIYIEVARESKRKNIYRERQNEREKEKARPLCLYKSNIYKNISLMTSENNINTTIFIFLRTIS